MSLDGSAMRGAFPWVGLRPVSTVWLAPNMRERGENPANPSLRHWGGVL